jgi:hypothetical protein
MYNPGSDVFEFLEVMNVGSAPFDLGGVTLSQGITFTFPSVVLAPGSHIVAVSNLASFQSRYGTGLAVAGVYSGSLSNGGERLRLATSANETILDFTYSDAWAPSTDGGGYSLVFIDPTAPPSVWGDAARWRASTALLGRPGALDQRCADGLDNDADTLADFPADPGCAGALQDLENPVCDDGLDNDGDTLIDGADPQCGAASGTSESPGPIDRFMCYTARTSLGSPRFTPDTALLEDAFDGAFDYSVVGPKVLCLPASGGSTQIDPDTHLEGYQIRPAIGTPLHVPQLGLVVTNEFGPVFLDTVTPDRLLVPTSKDLTSPVPLLDFDAHDVDHYKCYTVKRTSSAPRYFPSGVKARIADQFEDRVYQLRKLSRLCNPVVVNGKGIKDPSRRLLCYEARRDRGQPGHVMRSHVRVHTDFEAEELDTVKESELCVPSS